MKKQLKYTSIFLAGFIAATATSAYADEGLTKIEAYLRPSLPITLNGEKVNLESSPVMVDGSTYLKLRDVANVTGLEVGWNDETQTVELNSDNVVLNQDDINEKYSNVYYEIKEIGTKIIQEGKSFSSSVKFKDGKSYHTITFNSNEYYVTNSDDYFYERESEKSYISEEFLLQLLSKEELLKLATYKYQINIENKTVKKITMAENYQ